MLEALSEIAGDADAAEACKVWLLRQKQLQGWESPLATASAVYALLLGDRKLTDSDVQADVMVEGQSARLAQGGGTGVYEKRFRRSEIRPEMGDVRIAEHNEGVSWGTVSWLHSEDVTDIKPKEGEPLAIKKRLFVRAYTAQGPVLKPATGVLPLGAELVTRLELRTDRDMEFVHVKDCRAGCGQPLSEVSRYRRRKGGLCYYESVCDRASDFFIDLLPKGVYVFEYACRLQRKGVFSSGLAEVQCLYAPECKGYSGGDILTVGQE